MTKHYFSTDELLCKLNVTGTFEFAIKRGDNLDLTTSDGNTQVSLTETAQRLGLDGERITRVTTFGEMVIIEAEPVSDNASIYDLARQAVEERQKQFPDETVTIWQGRGLRVRVYRSQDLILMDAVNGDPRKAERLRIGYLSVYNGWQFDLSRDAYERWTGKAKRLAC